MPAAAAEVDKQAAMVAKIAGPPPVKPKKRGTRVKKAETIEERLAKLDADIAKA